MIGVDMSDITFKVQRGKDNVVGVVDLDSAHAVFEGNATWLDNSLYEHATEKFLGRTTRELPTEVLDAWREFLEAYYSGDDPLSDDYNVVHDLMGDPIFDSEEEAVANIGANRRRFSELFGVQIQSVCLYEVPEEHEHEVTQKVKRAKKKASRQTISLRLDDGLLKALDAYAESRGCTRTEVIEEAVAAHIGYGVESHESALTRAVNRLTDALEGISR